ncbi:hypothetical protein Tco_0860820 [Tanacetum coccineum]|uniref:Uncharacterized protein n=1 Tax=Tanacetum coccineum TaxID=301880 RepID=A0ABQ5BGW1_9ASTR
MNSTNFSLAAVTQTLAAVTLRSSKSLLIPTVRNREHSKKIKKERDLRKKIIDQYRWITSNRLKSKTIIDIDIYPNTKPVVITVYRGTDRRKFDVHNPFNFSEFGVTKLDELGPIIQKKNKVVGELMTSLGKRYDRLNVIPEELGISSSLLAPGQPKNGLFFIDVFGNEAFQRMSDIHKVDVDVLLTYLVLASNITTPANQRFCLALRSLIKSQPDKEKLKSKRVKLEVLPYSLN